MSNENPPGVPHEGENRPKPASTANAFLKVMRQLVGIAFLVWSVFSGGALLRWLIFDERDGWIYDFAQIALGGVVAALLCFIWLRIAKEDRDYVVMTITRWALAIALALAIKIYWPEH